MCKWAFPRGEACDPPCGRCLIPRAAGVRSPGPVHRWAPLPRPVGPVCVPPSASPGARFSGLALGGALRVCVPPWIGWVKPRRKAGLDGQGRGGCSPVILVCDPP